MYIMSFENILIVLIKTYGSTVYNHTLKKTQIPNKTPLNVPHRTSVPNYKTSSKSKTWCANYKIGETC